jgi:ferredoxin, 2Fe-2S
MDHVMLGNSGLAVSRLAFGAMTFTNGGKSMRHSMPPVRSVVGPIARNRCQVSGIVPNVQMSHNRGRTTIIGELHGAIGMPKLNVILRSGERRSLDVPSGLSLKEGLMAGGVAEVNALTSCGGCCSCGTCQVYLSEEDFARLPPMKLSEDEVLSINDDRRPTSRLSCQVKLGGDLNGITVTIAPEL